MTTLSIAANTASSEDGRPKWYGGYHIGYVAVSAAALVPVKLIIYCVQAQVIYP